MTVASYEPYDGADEREPREGVLSLRDILLAFRRRWWVIALVFAVIVGVGMWHTLRQPRLYRASTTVQVQEEPAPISGMQMATARDYRIDPLKSEQLIIRSQEVAERVAEKLGLRLVIAQPEGMRRRELFDNVRVEVSPTAPSGEYRLQFGPQRYALVSGGIEFGSAAYGDSLQAAGLGFVIPGRPSTDEPVILAVVPLHSAAGQVRGGIGTEQEPATNIIRVSYTGTDPALVQAIATSVARTYAEFSALAQRERSRAKTQFIADAIAEQRQRLVAAQTDLQRFKESNQSADVSADIAALQSTIHTAEADRRQLIYERGVYEALLGRLSAADTVDADLRRLAGTAAVAQNQLVAQLYNDWLQASRKREQLLAGASVDGAPGRPLQPQHPDVRAVDRVIADTKEELRNASEMYLQALQTKIQQYDRTVEQLRQEGERYPSLQAVQERLQAAVESEAGTLDRLMGEYQMARIAESVDPGHVRLIDEAQLPTHPVAPNRTRALILLSILGLLLGAALALLLERMDTSVKSPEEVERFGIPVLGLIPTIKLSRLSLAERTPASSRLVSHEDPRSAVAEAYRSLRTNLAFARAQRDLRTVVLSSPGPADGKSTSVANLAITFAQQGQRTLLVDADLRRPVLDKTFAVEKSPGLTDAIIGKVALKEGIRPTAIENLWILPSGHTPPNPSELLGSGGMRRLLEEAESEFDVVLLDSPPLLAVTDAAVLSTAVDGVILVVRMEETVKEAVKQAVGKIRAVNGRMLGALLNDADMSKGRYYGGYGYYYYAYYGESGKNGNGRRHGVLGRLGGLMGRRAQRKARR